MADAEDEGVPPEFECSICMKLLLDPVSVPCGHTFCKACLEQSLGYRGQCAVCRAPVAAGQAVNVLIRGIIADRYPQALAERRAELEEELKASEQEANAARQREVAATTAATHTTGVVADAGGGTANQQAPILPLLRRAPLFLPYCRIEVDLHNDTEVRLVEYALQGGRRLGGVSLDDRNGHASGVCLEIERVDRLPNQLTRVYLVGKFRFNIAEPPQVHEEGFELGRCEALFDTPLNAEELVSNQERSGVAAANIGDEAEPVEDVGIVPSALDVARSALELVERQFVHVGVGGRHEFTNTHGETPGLRGATTTSVALEQVSFWLLGAIISPESYRRQWLASTDTRGRLEVCRTRLQQAGTRPVLDLPGARSWMNSGQSGRSSLLLMLAIIVLFIAKATGFFDERNHRRSYEGLNDNDGAMSDVWATLSLLR